MHACTMPIIRLHWLCCIGLHMCPNKNAPPFRKYGYRSAEFNTYCNARQTVTLTLTLFTISKQCRRNVCCCKKNFQCRQNVLYRWSGQLLPFTATWYRILLEICPIFYWDIPKIVDARCRQRTTQLKCMHPSTCKSPETWIISYVL